MTVYLVQHTAKEMAGEFYEEACRQSGKFRLQFPSEKEFISVNWKQFLPMAKGALVSMLGDSATPEHRRKEIYNALIENRWRGDPPPGIPLMKKG